MRLSKTIAAALLIAFTSNAKAEDWPNRPLTMVVLAECVPAVRY